MSINHLNILAKPFLIALVLGYVFTPLSIKLAHTIGAVDIPEETRNIHKKPTPRLGGLAIFLAFIISLLFFSNVGDRQIFGIIIGAIVIVGAGVYDDVKGISPKSKLFFQILAAAIVVFFGIRIEIFTNFFTNSNYIVLGAFSIPVTIFWIVGITNTVNLIDGLDGLAVGVSIIASFTLAYVALVNGRIETAILLVILAGSSLGFLPFNFNPADVFMGDTGSLFLGYILGVISIVGAVKGATTLAYVVPILALGLPIFDTSFAILRRYLTNKPIMEADRGHLHHKLLDIGFEHKSAVLILYLISILLGIAAVFFSLNRVLDVILVLTLVVFMITVPINKSTDIEK